MPRLRGDDWREIAWPFPRDGWPTGRAFRCASCGDAVEVYVRPKIGFCNCDRGVTDDDEVDRVADLDLLSERFVPLEAGKVVHVADMQGRIRAYDVRMSDGSQRAAIGIAVSRRCDLLVAVAQGKGDATKLQRVALNFSAQRTRRAGSPLRWKRVEAAAPSPRPARGASERIIRCDPGDGSREVQLRG